MAARRTCRRPATGSGRHCSSGAGASGAGSRAGAEAVTATPAGTASASTRPRRLAGRRPAPRRPAGRRPARRRHAAEHQGTVVGAASISVVRAVGHHPAADDPGRPGRPGRAQGRRRGDSVVRPARAAAAVGPSRLRCACRRRCRLDGQQDLGRRRAGRGPSGGAVAARPTGLAPRRDRAVQARRHGRPGPSSATAAATRVGDPPRRRGRRPRPTRRAAARRTGRASCRRPGSGPGLGQPYPGQPRPPQVASVPA